MGQIIEGRARPADAKRRLNDRLVSFASHVLAGKSYKQAALAAGYSESYAAKSGSELAVRARAQGLLPDPAILAETVTSYYDAIGQIQRDMQDALPEIAQTVIELAKAGEPRAWKEVFDRTMGPIAQRHLVDVYQVDALVEGMLRDAEDLIDDPETLARLGQRWKARLSALPAKE